MENDPRDRPPNKNNGWAKCWWLKKVEADALLREGTWTVDKEHSLPRDPAYVSDRGELLLYRGRGRSLLYASRQELREKMEESRKNSRPTHVLEGLLPQGPHFIEAVPSLLDELAAHLKLPREALDGSFESLHQVDEALKKVRPRRRILETPNFFAGLVAYTGEVLRRETGGVWKLNELPGDIHEPYVHFGEDHRRYINPFLEPYKAIAEHKRGGVCLAGIVAGLLMAKGIEKGFA